MKNYLVVFAVGFLLGLFISQKFLHRSEPKEKPTIALPSPKQLQNEAAQSEYGALKKFDSLKAQSAKLSAELKGTKSALQKEKQKSFSLHLQIFELLDKRFEQQQKRFPGTNALGDSVIAVVPMLIESSLLKDSLCESMTANLEAQVRNRDSAIKIKGNQYEVLKKLFEKSAAQQTLLEDQKKMLSRQTKRQKVKSKILSAGFCILSGVAASCLLRH